MYVLTVIPITNRPVPSTLSYYSKHALMPGAWIAVPLGSASVFALVVACESLKAARLKIKTAAYNIKTLNESVQPHVTLPEVVLDVLAEISHDYLASPHHVLHTLMPEALQEYVTETASLPRADNIYIYPTWREASFAAKFRHPDSVCLHTNLTKNQQKKILHRQPNPLVTTPSFAWIYLVGGSTGTLHQAASEHYYRPRRPWFDYAVFLEALAKSLGAPLTKEYRPKQLDASLLTVLPAPLNDKLGYAIVMHPNILLHIKRLLESKKKVLVISPRTGFATGVRCRDCGTVAHDERTGDRYRLEEVEAGEFYYTTPHSKTAARHTCQHCGGTNVVMFGFGTEAFDKILKKNFANEPYFRIEAKTGKRVLRQAEQIEAGLILGTWSATAHLAPRTYHGVVLGLEFLLGIPGAYQLERTLGRLGDLQNASSSCAISQHDAAHPLMQALTSNSWDKLVQGEVTLRKKLGYPPHGQAAIMRTVLLRGASSTIRQQLKQQFSSNPWVWYARPSQALTEEITITFTAPTRAQLHKHLQAARQIIPEADIQINPRSL